MATVKNSLINNEVSLKKAEAARIMESKGETIGGRVPTIIVSRVSRARAFVGLQYHEAGYDGSVKLDQLPDGAVLAQFVNGSWR